MSIFDTDDNINVKIDRDVNSIDRFEKAMLTCVMPGTVKCVGAAPDFADRLLSTLEKAKLSLLPHKGRKVIAKDCRGLKKGDALGWIRDISKDDKDVIVVLENVTQIPEGDPALYDPKQYVENILVRSWKNIDVYIDDYHIDRRNLTVILTCPPEDEEQLRAICSMCSYAWVGDIEEKIESKLAELYTESKYMSEKKGIVLNRMYTGSYLSSNLGHEVINMFPDDDGSHYMYLNATGDFSAEHVGKIGSMLLIKYAGQDEDGRPWVEVLGCATGLKDVYNPNRVPQNKETSLFSDDKSKNFEGVKYGGVPIHDVFGDAAQQKVFISYYAEKLLVPKEDIKIFLRFAPFSNRTESSIKFAYSDKPDVEPDSSTYQSIIGNIERESYLWKQTSDGEAVPLYISKVYVVEMETKFASTSLKRYFIYKKAVGTDADKITKANNDLNQIDHLISFNRLWRPSPELPLIEKVNLNNEAVENDEVSNNNDVSIFDICRIENNENCFSNALAHFMDKYRAEWCEFFKKDLKIDLGENFEIFREIDATIPKNNNDETDNSDERNKKGGRIDLLLKDNENIIIIENKIKSDINGVKSDGDGQQLKRYQDYAHWLKYQHELDKIKSELKEKYVNSTYFDVQVDAEGNVSITIKLGNNKSKKPYLRDNKVEEQGKEKWREYNVRKLSALKVHLFILYPNYNIPHIPKECKEEWGHITYQNISDMLKKYFPLSRDSNLMDFFNVMQRHKYKNLCDWMRVDMRKQFIARIK